MFARARSRPFAQTASLQRLRPSERTRPSPNERRTLPFLPRDSGDSAGGRSRVVGDRAGSAHAASTDVATISRALGPGEASASRRDILVRPGTRADTFAQRV